MILGHTRPLDGLGLSGLGSQAWDARLCTEQDTQAEEPWG